MVRSLDVLGRLDRAAGMLHSRIRRNWTLHSRERRRLHGVRSGGLPQWARELVGSGPASGMGDMELASSAASPFVRPELSNPVRRGLPTDAPEPFRDLAQDACFDPGSDLFDLERWSAAQRRYRSAQRQTRSMVCDGADPYFDTPVTVVCVTNRPPNLPNVLQNCRRQSWKHTSLVLVLNGSAYEAVSTTDVRTVAPDALILRIPDRSLGQCLNEAMDRTDDQFVAKFDDDDLYGEEFLGDLMLAHRYAAAGVVGKHSCFAHLARTDRTIVRFPGAAFCYTPFLAGGTLLIDRGSTEGVRFPDVSLGEDQVFIRRCLRRGVSAFAADPFNYVQVRSAGTAWPIADDHFAAEACDIGPGRRLDLAFT